MPTHVDTSFSSSVVLCHCLSQQLCPEGVFSATVKTRMVHCTKVTHFYPGLSLSASLSTAFVSTCQFCCLLGCLSLCVPVMVTGSVETELLCSHHVLYHEIAVTGGDLLSFSFLVSGCYCTSQVETRDKQVRWGRAMGLACWQSKGAAWFSQIWMIRVIWIMNKQKDKTLTY